jgi:uncharacterized protein YdaU (DUF1376 family)
MSADRINKSLWFPLYYNDYLNDTRGLNFTQHGGYVMCMIAYYGSEKQLPGDLPTLYRTVGAFTEDEQAAVRFIVERFFTLEDGAYRQKRIDTELAIRAEKRGNMQARAKAGAAARWSNTAKEAARKLDQPTDDTLEDALVNATTRYTMANPQQDPEKIVEAMSVAVWTLRQQGLPDEKIINGLDWLMHQQNKDLTVPEEPVEQA